MPEKRIQLPDFLIAELYKGSLVELGSFSSEAAQRALAVTQLQDKSAVIPTENIRFLGENIKGVIIIVDQPDVAFLQDEDLAFLINILKACHLTLSDIAIINKAGHELTFEAMQNQLHPSTMILFDVEPSAIKLPFMIPTFQVQKFANCNIMLAPPLPLLNMQNQNGKLLKTKLWLSLKSLFNIG